MSLTGALNAANSSLRFNQNAISVTSKNVANANTAGYTRQVITAENQVLSGKGQGVSSGTITRYSDQILQTNMDQQSANLSYNKTVSTYFSTIESHFGKLSVSGNNTSLDSQISDMFTQMNNLIQDPTLSSNRVTFKNSTTQTVDRINDLASELTTMQISLDDQISTDLTPVNAALKNISDLNGQIATVERANGNSSDLKDLRQKEIATLSEYVQVKTEEKEDGIVHVTLNSGKVLVDSTYVEFSRTTGTPFGGIGFNRVLSDDGTLSNSYQELNSEDLSSGSIGAMVNLRDEEIPKLLEQLDNFALEFIEEFNNIHSQGSAVPSPATLTSASHTNGGTSTLVSDLGLKAGTDFDISIVDTNGKPVATTANLDYTGSVTSTATNMSVGTFNPQTYLTANGDTSTIEGTATIQYTTGGVYQMTDPSGSVHTAVLSPNTYPVDAVTPATLDFGNGVVMSVNAGSAQPADNSAVGTVDLNLTGGAVRIEAGDTLDDLAAKINANPALNGSMTVTVVGGALQLTSNNSSNGIVLGNDPTGDTFNKLGFNRYFEGDSASTIAVSDSITSNLNNIATGRMRSDGGFTSTNNENAVALANLQNKSFSFSEAGGLNAQDSTLSEYFISITSSFAANVSANGQQEEFNQALYDDFNSRVQSLSGVNTDEEFSNLVVYQRSFEAASRMISTIDQMLETLINMV